MSNMKINDQTLVGSNLSDSQSDVISKKSRRHKTHINNEETTQNRKGSFFAGDLNCFQNNSVMSKRLKAKKDALQTQLRAFLSDSLVTDEINKRKQIQTELYQKADELDSQMNDYVLTKESLKDEFGITDDSEEQNLELLEKQIQNPNSLTDDEKQTIKNMGPLTEYQENALSIDSEINRINHTKRSYIAAANNENKNIDAIKLEHVKSTLMIDATKEADDILKKAGKTLINDLINEAKDNIDQTVDKAKEDGEKQAEYIEEMHPHENKDKELEEETMIGIQEAQQGMDKFKKEIDALVSKNQMTYEDVKGLAVDEEA